MQLAKKALKHSILHFYTLLSLLVFFLLSSSVSAAAHTWTMQGDTTVSDGTYVLCKNYRDSYGGLQIDAPFDTRTGIEISLDYYIPLPGDDTTFMVELAENPIEAGADQHGYRSYYGPAPYTGVELNDRGSCCIPGIDFYNSHLAIITNSQGGTPCHVNAFACRKINTFGVWHTLKISCKNNCMDLYLDHTLVLSSSVRVPAASYIGITSSNVWRRDSSKDDNVRFRNLQVNGKYVPTVNFNTNGGKCSVSSMRVFPNQQEAFPTPERTGYKFLGWYTQKTGGTKVNASSDSFSDGQILYAHWRPNQYQITFNANGGKVSQNQKMVSYNEKIGKLPKPKRTKGTFLGWYTEKTGGTKFTSSTIYLPMQNITLYAHWKLPMHKIVFHANGGKVSKASKKVAYGDKISLPKPSRGGYTFLGWYTKKTGGKKLSSSAYTVKKNATIYAHWKAKKYTITFNANGGIIPETTEGYRAIMKKTAVSGKKIGKFPKAEHKVGKFLGWYTEETGGKKVTSKTLFTFKKDITFYAHWDLPMCTIKFDPNGGDFSQYAAKTEVRIQYGKSYSSFPRVLKPGYRLSYWYSTRDKRVYSPLDPRTYIFFGYTVTGDDVLIARYAPLSSYDDDSEKHDNDNQNKDDQDNDKPDNNNPDDDRPGGGGDTGFREQNCPLCDNGYVSCGTCGGRRTVYKSGKGYETCHACGGSGKWKCTKCGGSGKLNY